MMFHKLLRRKTEPSARSTSAAGISHPLQERIGYTFREPGLLLRALTHPSYVHEHPEEGWDNQRLEFLGDAVLSLTVAEWVFHRYPEFREGEMTRLRAVLVSEEMLARFAAQLGLGDFLRLGRGEEERGGRERAPNLADALEAVVGAMYLDGGLEPVRKLVRFLMAPMAEAILAAEADKDAKSRFQEWAQAELGITPRYRIVAERPSPRPATSSPRCSWATRWRAGERAAPSRPPNRPPREMRGRGGRSTEYAIRET